uniref:3'(2'),5'-bisphosphate nucleotidase CysQ n=1 Tax=Flavobacterium sp. TaxID=239 RepID=UPI0040490362
MIEIIVKAAQEAGKKILEIYNQDFEVFQKADESPLTKADQEAHQVIEAFLKTTNIPVLSEEGKNIPYEERKNWKQFWMVDPLDGTKEFVKKNGEFTVNIALIENQKPVMGVVYAPVKGWMYIGDTTLGAYKLDLAPEATFELSQLTDESKLPKAADTSVFKIVGSRSHASEETELFIAALQKEHGNVDFVSMGSSLKLCLVAEGAANIYPRLAPTMEWDTAAGHAVCSAAGKKVQIYKTDADVLYNKENLLNPFFVVS